MKHRTKVAAKTSESNRENSVSRTGKADFSQSISSPIDHILHLQRTIGNQAVQRLFESGAIQAKLKIGQPNDIYEQEAGRVAEQVMRTTVSSRQKAVDSNVNTIQKQEEEFLSEQITPLVQRQEEEPLMTKSISGSTPQIRDDLYGRLSQSRGGGQPLPDTDRSFMERRFGVDFSGVRVHTDSNAVQMSRELNAQAFTHGRDIYFGSGKYSPGISSGKKLLAHELTHVVQQGKAFNNAVDFTIQRTCSTANIDDCSDEDLLTAICIGEAGNIRDRDGKKGVVNVVMNRLADSAFPNTIRGVVTATGQFGGLNQGIRNLNNTSFSDCRVIAREVFNNPTDDPTSGAIWFNQSCSKPCYQYCTTYLGDGSSPAHYFARRATTEERRSCRGRRRWPCCHNPRTRISYITFTEEEVEPIVAQPPASEEERVQEESARH